mgnify:CR=1 FL=1
MQNGIESINYEQLPSPRGDKLFGGGLNLKVVGGTLPSHRGDKLFEEPVGTEIVAEKLPSPRGDKLFVCARV